MTDGRLGNRIRGRSRILALLVLGMMILQAIPSSVRAEGIDLEYTMIVTNPESHKAEIRLIASNLNGSSLTLTMNEFFRGYYDIPIEDLKAFDETEKALNVQFYRSGDARIWKIQTGLSKKIFVDYIISMNLIDEVRGEGAYMGYLGKDYGASLAAWTFLVPSDIAVNTIRVRFELPKGWKSVTPWTEMGGYYSIDSFGYFITSTYAIGNFDFYRKQIKETNITIAIWSGLDRGTQEELSDYSFRAFEYIRNVWGEKGPPKYLCIFFPPTEDKKDVGSLEYSQSQGLVHWDMVSSVRTFTHRIFHIWNGWPPYGMQLLSNDEDWYGEGLNRFYDDDKILFDLGIDTSHSIIKGIYKNYLNNIVGTKYDVPVTKARQFWKVGNASDFEMSTFLIYLKGALISFMLDYEIKETTNGRKNMNDLLFQVYKKYGHYGHTEVEYWGQSNSPLLLSNKDILNCLKEITNQDFTQFFNDYIYGNRRLELDIYFKDSDNDGLTDIDEKYQGTNSDNPDTDGDKLIDGVELRMGTDPKNKDTDNDGLEDGKELGIVIDGKMDDWRNFSINPIINDSKDSTGDSSTDIKSIYAFRTDKYLYVMFEMYGKPRRNAGYLFAVDTNNDGRLDFSIGFESGGYSWAHPDLIYNRDLEVSIGNNISFIDEVAEYRISLSELKNDRLSSISAWILLYQPLRQMDDTQSGKISYFDLIQTDPLNPDTDGDGLKDGVDPHPTIKESQVQTTTPSPTVTTQAPSATLASTPSSTPMKEQKKTGIPILSIIPAILLAYLGRMIRK